MNTHKQILDPLSTLCKIASLAFYESGSKISVIDNIVTIQKAENKQWIVRTYRGDTKEHLSLLYNPIFKAIQWYIFNEGNDDLFKNSSNNDNDNDIDSDNMNHSEKKIAAIKNIMKYAIIGLKNLKDTYRDKEGNVILALQFLINNLKLAIVPSPSYDAFLDFNDIIDDQSSSILNYHKIKEIWDIETIENISDKLTLCEKHKNEPSSLCYMVESLNLLLKKSDNDFKEIVRKMNSEWV